MSDSNKAPRLRAAFGITKENMLFTLPPALKGDESTEALAEATAEALEKRLEELERLRIVPNIDGLEEELLEILARDFKVDWWDPSYTLEEKRRTVKGSWRVHKTLGTKAAVETAISAIYPHTKVLEWWQYGGEPYHFRLDINITNDHIDSEKQRRVLERLNYYKSLRSHNDGVTYFVEAKPAIAKAASSVSGLKETLHVSVELPTPIIQPTARVRAGAITGLWESTASNIALEVPVLRRAAIAKAGASAGMQEAFTTRVILPDTDPPSGRASANTGVSSAWQERYTTGEIRLETQAPTASAQAKARGAVTARQDTAQTIINFSRR